MSLSIIIPAFEEGKKIARDIREATAFLKDHDIAGEIIVVDDGSQDDTAEAAERVPATVGIPCHVFRLDVNRGKGFAVRTGVAKAIGDHIMFADSGCCVPYENVLRGLEMIDKGECEIAHGSRKMDGCRINRPQSRWRRVCSRLFRWVVHSWLRMPSHLTDTQCGFKVYRGDVAKKLYAEAITDGFSFDVEIIIRAPVRLPYQRIPRGVDLRLRQPDQSAAHLVPRHARAAPHQARARQGGSSGSGKDRPGSVTATGSTPPAIRT